MRVDLDSLPTARSRRRDAHERLREALLALARHRATIVRHAAKAWASVTFEGARHTLELEFSGPAAVEAGERFVARLADHEFAIPQQIVADAVITAVDHRLEPALMRVECAVLLLEDA